MKYFITFLIAILINCSLATEVFHVDDAYFRVILNQDVDESSFIPNNYLLPSVIDGGVKVFDENQNIVNAKIDKSNRAIILPKTEKKRVLYLYPIPKKQTFLTSIFPQQAGAEELFEKDYKENMLTLEELGIRRQDANKKQYLDRVNNILKRRNDIRYKQLVDRFDSYLINKIILPQETGIITPTSKSWWEVNSIVNQKQIKHSRYSLYVSGLMKRNYAWRIYYYYPLKAFFPDNDFYKRRFASEINQYVNVANKSNKEWNDTKNKKFPEVLFKELEKNIKILENRNLIKYHYPSNLQIDTKKMDFHVLVVLRYSGNLNIEESGNYEFEVATNALWQMKINKKIVAEEMLSNNPKELIKEKFKVTLDKGVKSFEFIYLRANSPQNITINIKPPNGEWSLLKEEMFTPSKNCKILSIETNKFQEFPIVRIKKLGAFMTSKQNFQQIMKLDLPDDVDILYKDNIIENNIISLPTSDSKTNLSLKYKNNLFELKNAYKTNLPEIFSGVVDMSLQVPPIIFDDEKRDMQIEIRNTFPIELDGIIEWKFTNNDGEIEKHKKTITIHKGFSTLPIQMENRAGEFEIELSVATFSVKKLKAKIINARDLSKDLKVIPQRFMDANGDSPVSIMLNRMSVSDLREWEFLEIFDFEKIKNILVIGDNIDTEKILSKRWSTNIPKYEIMPWKKENVIGTSSLLRTIPKIIEKINGDNTIDSVLINLPYQDILVLGEDAFYRYICLVAENLKYSPHIKKVFILTSPNNNIFAPKIAREYGFELL